MSTDSGKDGIRADLLEHSVIAEIAKLSEQHEVVAKLVDEYVANNCSQLPPLEQRKRELTAELAELRTERDNTSRWLGGNGLTTQAVGFINSSIEALADRETAIQEELWQIEDQVNALAVDNLNATAICDALADWVTRVHTTDAGERKLLVNAVVRNVTVGHEKEVTAVLQPPLSRFGFLSWELAPRSAAPGRPQRPFEVVISFTLPAYHDGDGVMESSSASCAALADDDGGKGRPRFVTAYPAE